MGQTDELIGEVTLDPMSIHASYCVFTLLYRVDFPVLERKGDVIGWRETARQPC